MANQETSEPDPGVSQRPRRAGKGVLTTLAVGLLSLDGVLLLLAGYWSRSWFIVVVGAFLLIVAGVVLRYHRRHQQVLEEVEKAKEALRVEVAELRRLIKQRPER